jgi:dsDNA-binding SOS-regulon protein
MKNRQSYFGSWLPLTALTTFLCLLSPANVRSQTVQNDRPVQDGDTTRQELTRFDQFLDDHPEISEQVRKDPSLVNNPEYEKNHPALQAYLADHPQIREEIKENPNAFMRQESRYDRNENGRDVDNRYDRHDGDRDNGDRDRDRNDHDTTRGELARFDQFLDSHREIAEQLRKDPSLVNNPQFESSHPALHTYLQDHPQIREELKENPNAFMRQEDRYDRHEGGRNDITRGELARFDQFLDSHREVAEQLRKDPSLVNNGEFTKNHPALYAYLQDHPEIREEIKENPNAFMRQEDRYDRQENGRGNDRDRDSHEQAARFGQFLNGHSNVADQLSKDPSLVKNQEFMENHPELRDYLKDNPDVQKELMANPPTFVKSAKEFSSDKGRPAQTQTPSQSQSPSSTAEPKPKQ